MRKLVLALLLAASFTGAFAQKLDDVKEKIDKQKWEEAREKLDKAMQDPKNLNNSTAWFYKAQIYQALSKTNTADPSLSAAAMEAMSNYLRLDEKQPESKRYLLSTLDNNKTAFDIYTSYFQTGASSYNGKEYQKAYDNFEKAITAFDMLKKYKLTEVPYDTTSILYAGIAAEQLKNYDNAVKYYSMLADMKVADTNYRGVYEYVVDYYVRKKDEANAKKYLTLGETLFPNHTPWLSYELDMVGDDKTQKMAKYEELMQKYPNSYDLAVDYGVLYFNYTYSNENKPADYEQRQAKLGQILQKAISIESTPAANYLMSRHINNQIADLEDDRRAVKGTTPADLAKKKDYDAKINAKYDELVVYSQKAYDLYAAQESSLKPADKAYYKAVIDDLISYYQIKKNTAKATELMNKKKTIQ